jgi:hypothetical protein
MIDVLAVKVGTRLKLHEGIIAEVTENMEDGMWLQVRYLEVSHTLAEVGAIELCHAQDIVGVLSTPEGS